MADESVGPRSTTGSRSNKGANGHAPRQAGDHAQPQRHRRQRGHPPNARNESRRRAATPHPLRSGSVNNARLTKAIPRKTARSPGRRWLPAANRSLVARGVDQLDAALATEGKQEGRVPPRGSREPHQRQFDREPGTEGNRQHPASRCAALHLLEDEKMPALDACHCRRTPIARWRATLKADPAPARSHRRCADLPGAPPPHRCLPGGVRPPRGRRRPHRAGAPHHLWQLAAENHAKPAVAQFVPEVAGSFRDRDRTGVLDRPACLFVTSTRTTAPAPSAKTMAATRLSIDRSSAGRSGTGSRRQRATRAAADRRAGIETARQPATPPPQPSSVIGSRPRSSQADQRISSASERGQDEAGAGDAELRGRCLWHRPASLQCRAAHPSGRVLSRVRDTRRFAGSGTRLHQRGQWLGEVARPSTSSPWSFGIRRRGLAERVPDLLYGGRDRRQCRRHAGDPRLAQRHPSRSPFHAGLALDVMSLMLGWARWSSVQPKLKIAPRCSS